MDMQEMVARCEAMQQYTKGLRNTHDQEIRTRVCGEEAHYSCHECGKVLCGIHATAHSDHNFYCKEHGPDEYLNGISGMILIEPPE